MPKCESSDKIAKSSKTTGNNRKPQTVVRLRGAAEAEKSFKKNKKVVDKKRQAVLI